MMNASPLAVIFVLLGAASLSAAEAVHDHAGISNETVENASVEGEATEPVPAQDHTMPHPPMDHDAMDHGAMDHGAMMNPAATDHAMHGAAADDRAPFGMAMHDDMPVFHLLLERFEYRPADEGAFHWDGQAWYGNDAYRLWLKSEGELSDGRFGHGQHEILYGRPILPYFDLQAGLRADFDDNPGRGWLAFGVQGLAPNFFEVSATAFASSGGHFAANAEASFDLLITQRLILQPSAEFDLYTKTDAARGIGSGPSSLEGGLRLRYEITRKFAPYIGLSYERKFGKTRSFALGMGEGADSLRFVFGLRTWI